MKKRLSLGFMAVLAVCAFVGVSQASAATEFGSGCAANDAAPGLSFISLKHGAGSPLPVTAPISGVITEWKVNLNYEEEIEPEEEEIFGLLYRPTLKVYQSAGNSSYKLVAETTGTGSPLNFHGTNTFTSRIPVQAGDYLGIGNGFAWYCETADTNDESTYRTGSEAVGSTNSFEKTVPGLQVPIVARVEPDVDGDGYGDETQDQCPQSALYQTACPVVTIGSKPFTVNKKAVTLYVSTSLSAPVGVTATVNLGKGKKATLKAAAKTVAPGTLAPFKLTLTSKVTKALAELPKSKSLKLSITASATNITGAASTSTSSVKLKGQEKPAPKTSGKKPKKK